MPTNFPPQSVPVKLWSPMRPWHFTHPRIWTRSITSSILNLAPLPVMNFRRVWLLRRPDEARCNKSMKTSVSGDHTNTSLHASFFTDARTCRWMRVSASSCECSSSKSWPLTSFWGILGGEVAEKRLCKHACDRSLCLCRFFAAFFWRVLFFNDSSLYRSKTTRPSLYQSIIDSMRLNNTCCKKRPFQ